jgi:hypothetical protein
MKPWYQSKTLAVNALILLLAVLDAAQALPIPATWAPYIIAAASVLNVVLRLTTNTGLSVGEDPMRAPSRPPSPRGAPAAADRGAPSLAEQLAAEYDVDLDKDVTPEDTV